MTTEPAVRARDGAPGRPPVISVIADLITAHLAWRTRGRSRRRAVRGDGGQPAAAGPAGRARVADRGARRGRVLPVSPLRTPQRRALRRSLGQRGRFLVVVTGGDEGRGGMYRRTAAILERVEGDDVAVICGRDRLLARPATRLAARTPGTQLTVHGYVDTWPSELRGLTSWWASRTGHDRRRRCAARTPLILTSYACQARRRATPSSSLRRTPAAMRRGRASSPRRSPACAATPPRSGGCGRRRAGQWPRAAADIAHLIAEVENDTIRGECTFRPDAELAQLDAGR